MGSPYDKDSEEFTDSIGLTTLQPGEQSQNGVLYSVENLVNALGNPEFADEGAKQIFRLYMIFKQVTAYPGIQRRALNSIEYDSMDNYCARLAFQMIINEFPNMNVTETFAQGMIENDKNFSITEADTTSVEDPGRIADNTKYLWIAKLVGLLTFGGYRARFVYNVQQRDKFCFYSWFGRSPAMLALMDYAAGKWTNPVRFLGLIVGQMIGMFSDPSDTDARTLAYVIWYPLKKKNFFWAMLYKIWTWKLMRDYPEGMKTVYETYFKNADMPVRKYAIAHH